MKLKTGLVTLATLALMAAGTAFAGREGGHEDMFKAADTNNDGKVSHDEFKAQHEKHMEEMFKKLDTNGDGFIDETEKKAGHDKMRDKMKEHRKDKMDDSAKPAQ